MPGVGIRFQGAHLAVQFLEKVDRTGEGGFKFGCVVHGVTVFGLDSRRTNNEYERFLRFRVTNYQNVARHSG